MAPFTQTRTVLGWAITNGTEWACAPAFDSSDGFNARVYSSQEDANRDIDEYYGPEFFVVSYDRDITVSCRRA